MGTTEFDEGAEYERWANSLGHYVDIPGVGLAFVPAGRDEQDH
ncbi:hypothetical protein [Actinopolymorpha pittospori]|uniref:Uncharacterized protein n=1 Tax=Actinopolymorpha pittospori TaxID=648752 RepID=A0A927MMA1_9ACTN|nr:hypothetical protein [Actinopolymorpha pittospori]MBE1603276.1 hypothetical protein [Actinopolymorpha pittospori]